MECIVDTNVLVYETFEDSEFHEEVVKKLSEMELIYVPGVVILELTIILKRLKYDSSIILDKIREIFNSNRYVVLDIYVDDIIFAIDILSRHGKNVSSLNDKIVLSVAKRLGKPIYTYDKDLKRQCKRLGVPIIE